MVVQQDISYLHVQASKCLGYEMIWSSCLKATMASPSKAMLVFSLLAFLAINGGTEGKPAKPTEYCFRVSVQVFKICIGRQSFSKVKCWSIWQLYLQPILTIFEITDINDQANENCRFRFSKTNSTSDMSHEEELLGPLQFPIPAIFITPDQDQFDAEDFEKQFLEVPLEIFDDFKKFLKNHNYSLPSLH